MVSFFYANGNAKSNTYSDSSKSVFFNYSEKKKFFNCLGLVNGHTNAVPWVSCFFNLSGIDIVEKIHWGRNDMSAQEMLTLIPRPNYG